MFSKLSSCLSGAVVFLGISVVAATSASAVTFQFDPYARPRLADAQQALAAFRAGTDGFGGPGLKVTAFKHEDFESYQAWNGTTGTHDLTHTEVGSFTSLGGHGTGNSAINGGTTLEVRNDDPFFWQRENTTIGGANWLDSNDTKGIGWDVGGLPSFNSVAFLLTDAADVGAKFSILVGGTPLSQVLGSVHRLGNGNIQLVRILLDAPVSSLRIEMSDDRLNDGFGIDGVTVANIAAVPVPPAAMLILSAFAAMAGFYRRRARTI